MSENNVNPNHQSQSDSPGGGEAQGLADAGARLHQMLCAYVLGEANNLERAEVERALASSADLRAERARIEATIGLVQSSLGGSDAAPGADTLPPSAHAELLAAAKAPRPIPFYRTSVFRLAAAVAAIAIVATAWKLLASREDARVRHLLARAEAPARPSAAPESSSSPEGSVTLGQLVEMDKEADAKRKLDESFDIDAANAAAPPPEIVDRDSVPLDRTAEAARLRSLGYAGDSQPGGAPPAAKGIDSLVEAPAAGARLNTPYVPEADPGRTPDSFLGMIGGQETAAGLPADGAEVARDQKIFVAREANEAPAEGTFGGTQIHRSTGGAAVSQGVGPATPGPAGPLAGGRGGQISAGPSSSGATTGGSNEFYLGKGEKKNAADADEETLRGKPEDPLENYFEAGKDGFTDDQRSDEVVLGENGELQRRRIIPAEELDRRIDAILRGCQRRPNERPRDMFFRFWGDNAYESAAMDKLSTFSVDVDTASYPLARRYLIAGHLPEKAQVRTEEFLNYFKPDVASPKETTFAIQTELAPSAFGGSDKWMLRVAIRGKEVSRGERQPLALTFVIDVSGSMKEQNRLELVKHAMRLLAAQLDARDSIAVVAFSNEARLILPMTSAKYRGLIESAIYPLQPDGGTNTEAGLRMGYEQAVAALTPNAHNRVVLLTDGVANIGITDPNVMTEAVARQRAAGIYLNTIGVGMNNHNDVLLEQLADKGDGICNYVDDAQETRRALVENFTGAFEPIARDVKVQVEFDPAQVDRYRLLGYENRAIADADFRNDKVDAGEVGAGHQVIALYEIVRTNAKGDGPLAKVHLRWKQPHNSGAASEGNETATEIEKSIFARDGAIAYGATSPGYRRSVVVAQFAEILRRSVHARGDSLDALIAEAQKLDGELKDPDFTEFVELTKRSRALVLAETARYDDCDRVVDQLRENCWRRAQLEDLKRDQDSQLLTELEKQNRELEVRLRELVRERPDTLRALGYTKTK